MQKMSVLEFVDLLKRSNNEVINSYNPQVICDSILKKYNLKEKGVNLQLKLQIDTTEADVAEAFMKMKTKFMTDVEVNYFDVVNFVDKTKLVKYDPQVLGENDIFVITAVVKDLTLAMAETELISRKTKKIFTVRVIIDTKQQVTCPYFIEYTMTKGRMLSISPLVIFDNKFTPEEDVPFYMFQLYLLAAHCKSLTDYDRCDLELFVEEFLIFMKIHKGAAQIKDKKSPIQLKFCNSRFDNLAFNTFFTLTEQEQQDEENFKDFVKNAADILQVECSAEEGCNLLSYMKNRFYQDVAAKVKHSNENRDILMANHLEFLLELTPEEYADEKFLKEEIGKNSLFIYAIIDVLMHQEVSGYYNKELEVKEKLLNVINEDVFANAKIVGLLSRLGITKENCVLAQNAVFS